MMKNKRKIVMKNIVKNVGEGYKRRERIKGRSLLSYLNLWSKQKPKLIK